MQTVGIDVGGANVKAADGDGLAHTIPFALWKEPGRLPQVLADLLAIFPKADVLAVTMTAELADCFRTKAAGVEAIIAAVTQAAGTIPAYFWQTGAEFVDAETARQIPKLVAAANWHALATWAARTAPQGSALLLDIGTTTTDIIPLQDGIPVSTGFTDNERLLAGELVYTGVRRTPICAIAHTVPFRSGYCPLAAELFATSLDVYLTLGQIAENPADCETANGQPATRAAAHDRLARMLCCDATEFDSEDAETVARFLADVQRKRICGPLDQVLRNLEGPAETVLISGSGVFLAKSIVEQHPQLQQANLVSLAEFFSGGVAEAACAFALARLAAERLNASGR